MGPDRFVFAANIGRILRPVFGATTTALILAGATRAWMRQRNPSPISDASVTVLPSSITGADTSEAYIAEEMAEDIMTILAANLGLSVKAGLDEELNIHPKRVADALHGAYNQAGVISEVSS